MGALLEGSEDVDYDRINAALDFGRYEDGADVRTTMLDRIRSYREDIVRPLRSAEVRASKQAGRPFDPKNYDELVFLGKPIPVDIYPAQITLQKPVVLPDMFNSPSGGRLVSQRFKDVVEQFDKGKHQFVKTEVLTADGSLSDQSPRYFFEVMQVFNAINPEGLKYSVKSRSLDESRWPLSLTFGRPFEVFKDRINGAGVWTDIRSYDVTFVSDACYDAFEAAGLTGWSRSNFKFNEV